MARGNRTHGLSKVNGKVRREHAAWSAMKGRCYSPTNREYQYYGARGIIVCERWKNSFEDFFADLGPRPSPLHSIERKDNDGNYEPVNCRWATKQEQARNRRNTHMVEYSGRKMSLAEACELAGVAYRAGMYRISVGKPFNMPIRSNAKDFR